MEVFHALDIERDGGNFIQNSIIQISLVTFACQRKDTICTIKVLGMFDVCIKPDYDGEKFDKILDKFASQIAFKLKKPSPGLEKPSSVIKRSKGEKMGLLRDELKKFYLGLKVEGFPDKKMTEGRCMNQFWFNPDKGVNELYDSIIKNGIGEKQACILLDKYLFEMNKKYQTVSKKGRIQIVSDNQPYDRASVDVLFNKYGMYGYTFKKGEFKTFENSTSSWVKDQPPPGKYNGFGVDSGDFLKGMLSVVGMSEDQFRNAVDLEKMFKLLLMRYSEDFGKTTRIKLVDHCALYDAAKIGLTYCLAKYGCVLKRRTFEKISVVIE